jgi:hypothetical protein
MDHMLSNGFGQLKDKSLQVLEIEYAFCYSHL